MGDNPNNDFCMGSVAIDLFCCVAFSSTFAICGLTGLCLLETFKFFFAHHEWFFDYVLYKFFL